MPVRVFVAIGCGFAISTAADVRAQTFPADGEYVAFECGAQAMSDPLQDEPGALDERDVVGDPPAPAGLRAFDAEFLYLRIRVDQDPEPNQLAPFAWGVEFDLDGDLSDYELMVMLDGTNEEVLVFDNNQATPPDDPTDPPDQPPVATYPFATHGLTGVAGSSFGGDDDFFIDVAAAWADLEPLGLDETTPIAVWVASSSTASSLDGDFACHDGAGGDPTLSDTGSDTTTVDDGDPVPPPRDTELQGGGGCAAAPAPSPAGLLLLAILFAVSRRSGSLDPRRPRTTTSRP